MGEAKGGKNLHWGGATIYRGHQFTKGGNNLQRGGNNLHWGGQQFASASVAQQLQTNPALNLILDPGGSGHIARSCIRFRSIGKARRSRAPRRGSVAHRGCRYTATAHGVGIGERGARGGGMIMMLMMIYGPPPTPATLRRWWWGGGCRRRGRTGSAFIVKQNNPVEPFWPTHPFCYYYEGTTTGVSFPVLDETTTDDLRVSSEEASR